MQASQAPFRGRAVPTAVALTALVGACAAVTGCDGCSSSAPPSPRASASPGLGCSAEVPSALPYRPGCCDYQVSGPEGMEAGCAGSQPGKEAAPRHLHVGWAGPTSTSFVASWTTDEQTTLTVVLYGTDETAVGSAADGGGAVRRAAGHHLLLEGSLLDGTDAERVHEVHVCGLTPATTYFYKVGGPGAWSPVHRLTTAPPVGAVARWAFAALGDGRDGEATWAALARMLAAEGPRLLLYGGDAVHSGSNLAQWNRFFSPPGDSGPVEALLATTPLMMVHGNHERFAPAFFALFAMPQDQSPGERAAGEEWYSFDYANAHFVVLNDYPADRGLSEHQAGWLRDDLSGIDRTKTPWIFVAHHEAMYSCGTHHGSNRALRGRWQPVLDEQGVDLVFEGHEHLYQRSKPLRGLVGTEGRVAAMGPNGEPIAGSGTVYVVTAGAGAPLYGAPEDCPFRQRGESAHHAVVVELEGRRLRLRALRPDGSTIDEVSWSK